MTPSLEQPISTAEAKDILQKHKRYLTRRPGGILANFSHKNISGFDFSGMDLSQANFTGARCIGTNFTDCQFADTIFLPQTCATPTWKMHISSAPTCAVATLAEQT